MNARKLNPRVAATIALAMAVALMAIWLADSTAEAAGDPGQETGQNNGQGTPLVLADIQAIEVADQQRFGVTDASNQARFAAIEIANQTRFLAIEQNNQARADLMEALIEAKIQEAKDKINEQADLIETLIGDLDQLVFDTHLVDELDMEITACANLGISGGAEFGIQGETVGKGLGRLGALVYGNGGSGQGEVLAKVAPALNAGGEVGIGLEACLGGVTVRQTDVAGSAAALRDAIDTLRTQLGLTEANASTALNDLNNISIPTDPFSVFTPGALPLVGSLPLPPQVAAILADPGSLVPGDLASLTPNCGNIPHNALGDLIGDACSQVDGNPGVAALSVIDDIKEAIPPVASQLEAARSNIHSGVNNARDSVNSSVSNLQGPFNNIWYLIAYIQNFVAAMPDDGPIGAQGPLGPEGPRGLEGPRGDPPPPPPPPSGGGGGGGG
ncbi:MAG: hypothetical protein O3A93_06295 [Chloroflexi bacterium]|nr:hypothetical protein [Chloroflexota bacterium]